MHLADYYGTSERKNVTQAAPSRRDAARVRGTPTFDAAPSAELGTAPQVVTNSFVGILGNE